MGELFMKILNMSITGSYVILFVIILRLLLKRAPKIFSYALWSVVLFRLICPLSFESVISLIPSSQNPIPKGTLYSGISKIGIPEINTSVNVPKDAIEKSVNSIDTLLFVVSIVWIIGVLALVMYSIVSFLKLRNGLKYAMHLEKNIYESENITTPFVLGIIKPKIYLPNGLSKSEKTYILKHEENHIKRFDYILKPFAFFVLCVHWFNPLVWIAFVLMSKDMEMSCDESVLKEMGSSIKKEYSSSLLSLSVGSKRFNGTPLAFVENSVKTRIKNVLNYKRPAFWIIILLIALVVLTGIALISNPKQGKEESLAKQALKYKTEYIGDASKVGNIIYLFTLPEIIKYDHFEIHTTEEPYSVTVYLKTSAKEKSEVESILPKFYEKNALIMFALVGNAGYINFNLSYGEGEKHVVTYNRDWANKKIGKDIRELSKNENEFNKLLSGNVYYSSNDYGSIINELKSYSKEYSVKDANKDRVFAIMHGQIKSDIKILNKKII